MNLYEKPINMNSVETEFDYIVAPDDYCGYFVYAEYEDGTKLSDDELEQLTEKYPEIIDEKMYDRAVMAADFLSYGD